MYVASIPNLATLGSRFVLQGGTQNNLAVVKAEVDFIRSNFRGKDIDPKIIVHEHCGESGAIGAAQEALRLWQSGKKKEFIGLDAVAHIHYRTTRNEDTRCYFCKNSCLRTFIDVKVSGAEQESHKDTLTALPEYAAIKANLQLSEQVCGVEPHAAEKKLSLFRAQASPLVQIQNLTQNNLDKKVSTPQEVQPRKTKVPLYEGEQRLIISTCEKGSVEDFEQMKGIKANIEKIQEENPNYVDIASRDVFRSRTVDLICDEIPDTKGIFVSRSHLVNPFWC